MVVGDEDKGDAEALLNVLQLRLHILAQLQIQSSKGLVKQKHLWTGHDRPCNGHPLLLTTGQSPDLALFKPLEIDQLDRLRHAAFDFLIRRFFDPQAKGDVFIHIQMRKEGVSLKNGANLPFREAADH